MSISVWHVLIAIIVVTLTYLVKRSNYYKAKLKWVGIAPAWPILGNGLDFADSTKSLSAMHRFTSKYDGICYVELLFRPVIIISDYKFVEWLLTSNTILTKSKDYNALHSWLEDGILTADGQVWRRGRKIITPAFHFKILERLVEVFERPTNVLIQLLNKEVDKDSIDIRPYMVRYGLDNICETAMGVQMNVQENENSEYLNAVAGMCRIVVERAFNPLKMIDTLYYLSIDHLKERRYIKHLHAISNTIIEKRKEELSSKTNDDEISDVGEKKKMAFLDLLLSYKDENNQPLSNKFIREQVDTLMFAGHDTTASANSFALYCLANHSDVQEKALQEIIAIMEGRDKITYQDLQEMKYLELVIKETLRLYPSVPVFSRQTTEDIIYEDDKIIPKGVTLAVVCYAINRNPQIYQDPDKFIPTRFLEMQNKPFSYLPFSAGPRNCVGQKFAMLSMKYTLAKMLLNFELLPAIPAHEPILTAESVLSSINGIRIRLKKRNLEE